MIVLRYTRHERTLLRGVAPGRSGRFRGTPTAGSAGSGARNGERYIIPADLTLRLSPIPGIAAAINRFGAAAGCEPGREFALAKWPIWALTALQRRTRAFGCALPGLAPTAYYQAARTRQIDRRG